MSSIDQRVAINNACSGYEMHIKKLEERLLVANRECTKAICALLDNGFRKSANGMEWLPPLGKRPDFEGADVISAVLDVMKATKVFQSAVSEYEARHADKLAVKK